MRSSIVVPDRGAPIINSILTDIITSPRVPVIVLEYIGVQKRISILDISLPILWLRHLKVFTDFFGYKIENFSVAGDGGALAVAWVEINGVIATFTK